MKNTITSILIYSVVILFLIQFFLSCEGTVFHEFGTIRNKSQRRIDVIWRDEPGDRDSTLNFQRNYGGPFYVGSMDTLQIGSEIYVNPDALPKDHKWHFCFYDDDSIAKLRKLTIGEFTIGEARRALLKIDTVTQEQILQRNVLLVYKEEDKK